MRHIAAAAAVVALFGSLHAPASAEQTAPVITPLPAGAVTLQACSWNAKSTAFDADVRIANHTNLPVDKVRLLLTFVNRAGEVVKAYADMKGSSVSLVPGVPMAGRWTRGTFPLSMKTMRCSLVGVKFQGYPNVIFSALK
jgi:hypothetical protein